MQCLHHTMHPFRAATTKERAHVHTHTRQMLRPTTRKGGKIVKLCSMEMEKILKITREMSCAMQLDVVCFGTCGRLNEIIVQRGSEFEKILT